MAASKSHSADWEKYRQNITHLYHQGLTQLGIQKALESQYDFVVSAKQLEYRLSVWGLRKNVTKAEYQRIQEAIQKRSHEGGKATDVYLKDVPIPAKKLKRNLQRYGSTRPLPPENRSIEASTTSINDITIITPPGSPKESPSRLDGTGTYYLRPSSPSPSLTIRGEQSAPSSDYGSRVASQLCWPYLPCVALILQSAPQSSLTVDSAMFALIYFTSASWPALSDLYVTTVIKIKHEPSISIYYSRKTPLFNAIYRSLRYMNSSWGGGNRYHDIMESSLAEKFLSGLTDIGKFDQLSTHIPGNARLPVSPSFRNLESEQLEPHATPGHGVDSSRITALAHSNPEPHTRKRPVVSENSESEPEIKRARRLICRSLDRNYACPFAKGDPKSHFNCLLINRKDLRGIREHMKRVHYHSDLPSMITTSRTWDAIFSSIYPEWGPRSRPSPYFDPIEIARRSLERPRSPETPQDSQVGSSKSVEMNTRTPPCAIQPYSAPTGDHRDLRDPFLEIDHRPGVFRNEYRPGVFRNEYRPRVFRNGCAPNIALAQRVGCSALSHSNFSPPGSVEPPSVAFINHADRSVTSDNSSNPLSFGIRPTSPSGHDAHITDADSTSIDNMGAASEKSVPNIFENLSQLTAQLEKFEEEIGELKFERDHWKRQYFELARQNRNK